MNRRSAIVVALLAFVALAPAVAAKKAHAEKPADALLHAEYFSVWGVGYAGTPTENERAFQAFMETKPAIAEVLRLIDDGTSAGKIYGLLALKILSPDQFAKIAPTFSKQRTGVKILHGCDPSPSTESTAKLVRGITEGTVVHQARHK